jgi:hypothetical protein
VKDFDVFLMSEVNKYVDWIMEDGRTLQDVLNYQDAVARKIGIPTGAERFFGAGMAFGQATARRQHELVLMKVFTSLIKFVAKIGGVDCEVNGESVVLGSEDTKVTANLKTMTYKAHFGASSDAEKMERVIKLLSELSFASEGGS